MIGASGRRRALRAARRTAVPRKVTMHNQQKSIGTFLAVTAPIIRLARALVGLEHLNKRCLAYSDDSKSKTAERSRVNGDIFDLRLPKNAPVVGVSLSNSNIS